MNLETGNARGAKSAARNAMNDLRLRTARQRLVNSRDEADAIEGLREIVANLLGCEEIGLFRIDRASASFKVCWSFGIDLENYDLLRAIGDTAFRQLMNGESYIDSGHNRGVPAAKAQAFIPIRFANQTVGILAILRLLPQKIAFDRSDMELFKLISDEAAKPLFGSSASFKAAASQGPGSK